MRTQKERFNFRRPEIIGQTETSKAKFELNLKPLKNFIYLLIIAALIYTVCFSSLFKVSKVEISGVKSVEISDYLKKNLKGKNILLMRTGKFLKKLEKEFPSLSEVRLVRGLPDTIKVDLLERNQIMVFCSLDTCFEVDNYGYAYQKIPKPSDKAVLIDEKNIQVEEGKRVLSDSFIYFYLGMLEEMQNLKIPAKEARIDETTFKVTFVTSEGWSIITDTSYSLASQISTLKQVLEKNRSDIHEYVDVRVEGVAYIK